MTAIPKKIRERLAKEVRAFQGILQGAKDRDVNEADTVTIVTDILTSVFGYDKYSEITSEYAIRNTFCDLAVKVEGEVKFLIEVKAIGLDLSENHLRQAVNYGANHGVQWVVLTNGNRWEVYKIRFERPVDVDPVCSFNLLDINSRATESQELLFVLCKEGLKKAAIEEYHQYVQIVNRFVIGAVLLSEPVLAVVRRELRRITPGLNVSIDEIERILLGDVLKRDVVEGETARDAQARVKKASGRVLRKRKSGSESKSPVPMEVKETDRTAQTLNAQMGPGEAGTHGESQP